jgi:hypothetical protein
MYDYDLDALLREYGGLNGLARELGQHGRTFIADDDQANDNEPRSPVGMLGRLSTRLGLTREP